MTFPLLLTCEHGGNRIPKEYKKLFRGAERTLASHRGWDPGALMLARTFERRLGAPLIFATVSRLLVELNRSPHHRLLFSEFTRSLDPSAKQHILQRFYYPYRQRVQAWIAARIAAGETVLHISVHSFAPHLDGIIRHADVGLLYDPSRARERDFCNRWYAELAQHLPGLRVRRNYPYLGKSDGLTTSLRKSFADAYLGIELEVNQALVEPAASRWRRLREQLTESLAACLRQAR
ncbi:MAG: hypothetical protein KatS3mg105_2003 [Gemmatales bacterium]|nr:MAG: hypothetical protein KatS3mg105_2003 [Gemmatales bacterium]